MTLSVYVAGAFVERVTRVRPMLMRMRAHGLTITHDWTTDPPTGVSSDADLTTEQRRRFAGEDIGGVRDADVLWLLAPNERGSCGAWVEFGYALALGITHTIVSGPRWDRSIFTELASWHFDSDSAALAFLVDWSREREAAE